MPKMHQQAPKRSRRPSLSGGRKETVAEYASRGANPGKGGILLELRRSPLAGADLKVCRSIADDRKVHL